jgi:hypothetical protein
VQGGGMHRVCSVCVCVCVFEHYVMGAYVWYTYPRRYQATYTGMSAIRSLRRPPSPRPCYGGRLTVPPFFLFLGPFDRAHPPVCSKTGAEGGRAGYSDRAVCHEHPCGRCGPGRGLTHSNGAVGGSVAAVVRSVGPRWRVDG